MIKLICFDLWSTLATRTDPRYHCSEELIKEFNLNMDWNQIINIFEETIQTKYWESEYDAYKELARNLEIAPIDKNIKKIINIREKAENNILLYDFTIPLLKKLKKNYKIALITNSSRFVYDMCKQKTELFNYVDYPLFSFMVGFVKPHPEMFLKVQQKFNLKNKEILMIGDTYSKDVQAPKDLGWNAIHFKGDYNILKKDLIKYDIQL